MGPISVGKHHDKSRFMHTKDLYEKPIRNAIINALKDPASPLVIKHKYEL